MSGPSGSSVAGEDDCGQMPFGLLIEAFHLDVGLVAVRNNFDVLHSEEHEKLTNQVSDIGRSIIRDGLRGEHLHKMQNGVGRCLMVVWKQANVPGSCIDDGMDVTMPILIR